MGQKGSKRLRSGTSPTSEITHETEIGGNSVIKTAFIVIGDAKQQTTARKLGYCLENSQGGRVAVSDLENVAKSVGSSFDEKLRRYLKESTGIVLVLSDGLKECIDHEKVVEVTINQTTIMLNGSIVNEILQDENLKRKFIPLSSCKDKLPKALESSDIINIPDEDVSDDAIEKVAKDIRPLLEGFQCT